VRARILLVALLALSTAIHAAPAASQVVFTSSPLLGMGFSPGSVSPIADGVPVYALGDQLWAESYSSGPVIVEVVNAMGTIVADDTLLPMSPTLVHTFSFTDEGGSWGLLAAASGNTELPSLVAGFTLVGNESVEPSMTAYRLTGDGGLDMNFSLASPGAYDIAACLVGSSAPSTVAIPVPSGLGRGQLGLVKEGNQVAVDLNGNVTAPFTFWAELHYDYSYTLGNSTVVSRDLEVAASNPVDVNLNFSGATTGLEDQLSMRTGRVSMWAFFESSQGISVYEAPLLIPDISTWVSLDGCTAFASSLAPTFSLSSSLAQPTQAWPREVYTMYRVDGVEMFSTMVIPIAPATIRVLASPWNEPFTNSELAITGSVGAPVQDSTVWKDTIYLTAGQYPMEVSVTVSGSEGGTVDIAQPFSTNGLNVGSGKVVVDTEANGKPVSGANVILSEGGSQVANASSVDGEATFYVLAGNYTVAGSYGNSTATGAVDAPDGVQSTISLTFIGSSQYSTGELLSYLLVGTALVGIAISAFVWVRAYRKQPSD
jgi:hypothetical protein